MMFEAGLFSLLSKDPGIQAAVGGSPTARSDGTAGVFPMQLPEASPLPALVYSVLPGHSVNSVQGTDRCEMRRVQIDCFAKHYEDVKPVAQAVKDCVLEFRGTLDDGTMMSGALKVSETDAFEEAPFQYRASLDFEFWIVNQATD
jgi:hypothetical protein